MISPDYAGGGLVNLMGELEHRLTGRSAAPPLRDGLAALIPEADIYVLVIFDGLGTHQLDHPRASSLADSMAASLDAPFPTTTTVSLATVSTGLPPSQHGLLAYQLWLPELGMVANTIKWTTLWGAPLDVDVDAFLPSPNLWERLRDAGREPITVQPGHFAGTPLSRVMYRGCRFEPVFTEDELVEASVQLAAQPGRLILVYVPHIDFAAHVAGQQSEEYGLAMAAAGAMWAGIARRLPRGAVAIGTADHGHVDIPEERRARLPKALEKERVLYGDSRVMFVRGEGAELAGHVPADWIDAALASDWWGPGPLHPSFAQRAPEGLLVADRGYAVLHSHSDERLIGQHGGITNEERLIPLLVSPRPHPLPV